MGDMGSPLPKKPFCSCTEGNSSRIWGGFPSMGGCAAPSRAPAVLPGVVTKLCHHLGNISGSLPTQDIPFPFSPRFGGTPDGSAGVRVPQDTVAPCVPQLQRQKGTGSESTGPTQGSFTATLPKTLPAWKTEWRGRTQLCFMEKNSAEWQESCQGKDNQPLGGP